MRASSFADPIDRANDDILSLSVSGKISDEAGEPIPFAAVQLFPAGSSLARYAVVTDDEGYFNLENVAKGRYDLFVSHVAFWLHILDYSGSIGASCG